MSGVADRVRRALDEPLRAVLRHPFVGGLVDGSLPRDAFARYLVQNHLYLLEYGRALALLAGRARDPADLEFFARRAAFAMSGEQAFMEDLMRRLDLDAGGWRHAEPSPACLAYANHVKVSCVLDTWPEALGAVLPCYVMYASTAEALRERGSADPHYQRWVDAYTGGDFQAGVRGALAVADRVGAGLAEAEVEALLARVRTSARYEWFFWEAAWTGEAWPALDADPGGQPAEVGHPRAPGSGRTGRAGAPTA